MRKRYPSDISREQFKKIEPILLSARKKTRPRKLDLYDIFCAVLYLLKSGCQWRMLPSDLPDWRNVYAYFRIWSEKKENENSLLEQVLKKLVGEIRISNGRNTKTSFCIVDAQSVKNTDTAENKGYDAGKKISGIKRHIAVDTQGLPHAIHITTANITDRDGAEIMITNEKENLSDVKNLLVDGGYTGEPFAEKIKNILGATAEVAKRSELHKFAVIPKRWVVERSFGWLEKRRRLWKNCERKINTSLQMVVLGFAGLLLKRF
ncbi:MAG: IS5/IS1182 family transposase [Gammaproteobacteria bacterium CG_4_10_14_0_8_um_filter_38_16]|nr:MAG: IS5/IS1182 family transposase [Gammaproteobacteria bacterium CG_4_10_14_0_8_um_filter_38_16]PJA03987.1 MAG: IS5/IS1182 family transposase [Gammaproteobacteria bacterium CG_4_10_14_0_2_um_filter_38_22]PJB11181.1 MAG: IS5/IS1182 family transposase [Gammaproteobacteria bacterium CG_4_9_14_3_um_filter_38_9]